MATYLFDLEIFVEKPVFLGYFTLSLMALISIAVGKPFTF